MASETVELVGAEDWIHTDLSHYVNKKLLEDLLESKWPSRVVGQVKRMSYAKQTFQNGAWRVWAPARLTKQERDDLEAQSKALKTPDAAAKYV